MNLVARNDEKLSFSSTKSTIAQWRLNMALEDFIQSYRRKLGSYDIKPWERAMEASVRQRQNLAEIPKRPTKLKTELIDVDLVRGSTFPKEKSHFSWTFFTRDSIARVIFLPFQREWWTVQSAEPVFHLLLGLYFLQLFSLIFWFFSLSSGDEWISASETLTPLLLMLTVSEILTQAERQERISKAHAFESVSDDASIDFDDLASLSDRSCRSSSPGDVSVERGRRYSFSTKSQPTKVRRKTKRRPSRSNGYGIDEVVHWQVSSSKDVVFLEDVQLEEKESLGFRPKRLSVPDGGMTSDSGLFVVSDGVDQAVVSACRHRSVRYAALPRLSGKGKSEDSEGVPVADDCMESDVSDMELTGWKAGQKKPVDYSTSDKEATDDETLLEPGPTTTPELPATFIREFVPCPKSPTFSAAEDDDFPLDPELLHSSSEQPIGCTLWEDRSSSFHKADLTVYEITNCIVRQAEANSVTGRSRLVLTVFPVVFALLPMCHGIFRTFYPSVGLAGPGLRKTPLSNLMRLDGTWTDWMLVFFKANGIVQRYFWGFWFFLLLAVAFEIYQQRYLIAKYFGYLTSSRRAKRANLPHFRLSKVRNVKSWLCVRSCLKKYGPRKSVDVVVTFSCMSCLICVIFTCFMVVNAEYQCTTSMYVWEAMLWLFAVGLFLLRFMVLGSKTNQKFRNSSILTTEQLNLYLRMEQKPHKKDNLMLVNNVLKLAADLIKEIEHPCKISGFPANPFLYNISRLLILSAFSTLISEICGFKLKLYKLKM